MKGFLPSIHLYTFGALTAALLVLKQLLNKNFIIKHCMISFFYNCLSEVPSTYDERS